MESSEDDGNYQDDPELIQFNLGSGSGDSNTTSVQQHQQSNLNTQTIANNKQASQVTTSQQQLEDFTISSSDQFQQQTQQQQIISYNSLDNKTTHIQQSDQQNNSNINMMTLQYNKHNDIFSSSNIGTSNKMSSTPPRHNNNNEWRVMSITNNNNVPNVSSTSLFEDFATDDDLFYALYNNSPVSSQQSYSYRGLLSTLFHLQSQCELKQAEEENLASMEMSAIQQVCILSLNVSLFLF